MLEDNQNKTWFVEDLDLFSDSLLGLKKPDGAFFLAVEGQSTDDGKVFINTLSNQEDFVYIGAVVKDYELEKIISNSKLTLRSRKFKEFASEDESEHGLAYWKRNSVVDNQEDNSIVQEKNISIQSSDDDLFDLDDDGDVEDIDIDAIERSLPKVDKPTGPSETYFVVMFGSQKSREFIEKAESFLAETSVSYSDIVRGVGNIQDPSFDEIKMKDYNSSRKMKV